MHKCLCVFVLIFLTLLVKVYYTTYVSKASAKIISRRRHDRDYTEHFNIHSGQQ